MYFHKILFPLFLFNFFLNKCAPIIYSNNFNKWTKELSKISKKEYHNLSDINDLTNRKYCGSSLKHLAGLILDKSDKEAKLIIEGSIFFNKLTLKLGNTKEKEIDIKNIILPIETLSNKCINIRQTEQNEESTILCLSSKVLRNFWINSITDAVLCKMTKIKGKLPEFDYLNEDDEKKNKQQDEGEDDEKNDEQTKTEEDKIKSRFNNEEFDDEKEEGKKGVQLRIPKSKYGQPDIKINGKTIKEIKEGNKNEESANKGSANEGSANEGSENGKSKNEKSESEKSESDRPEEYENASDQIDGDDETIES
ncbi:conserved protein, unknown function [Hepatocystis sp. ex Piliocolobus tephrosceles]|nr:conserved protein, unknown function [Hepatocystis sp. ex Piliocolobus tephrosceles]